MNWKLTFCLILLLMSMVHCEKDPDGIAVDEEITEEGQENQEEQDEQTPEQESTNDEEDEEEQEVYTTTTPFSTSPSTTLDYCHCDMEIYGLKDLEGVLKSPNYPGAHCNSGKCIYKILPHPDMTLRLTINNAQLSSGTVLKIWTILDVNGEEYNIYHSEYGRYRYDDFNGYGSFTTAKNVGIKIIFKMQKNTDVSSGFKMSFERISDASPKELCPTAHVIVGHHYTEVSESKPFSIKSGCSFYLSPARYENNEDLGEMVIEIKNPGDAYVSIRSYGRHGLFEEDSFSTENRTKLVDASRVEVMFRGNVESENNYLTPKIMARLVNQSCNCPPSTMNLTVGNLTVVRSPGFPYLLCPTKECQVDLISARVDEGPRDTERLISIMTKYIFGVDDYLEFSSIDAEIVIFRIRREAHKHAYTFRPLMLKSQSLRIIYESSDKLQFRFFEMNFTVFEVPKKCVCSVFNDKVYTDSGSISVKIPHDCPTMHCHWKFSAKTDYSANYISVEFVVDHPLDSDVVYLFSDKIREQVQGGMLTMKTAVSSSVSPMDFTFSRFISNQTALQDSVLNITWKTVEECDCGPQEYYLQFGEFVAITSPHFPEEYCYNLACQHVFYAPEGGYLELCMDFLYLEKYHDFLNVYDGNGTIDPLIARISGTNSSISYNSTDRAMYLTFITDSTNSNKGYHANIYAHKKEGFETPIETHWIVSTSIIAVIAVIAVGAAFVFFFKKKCTEQAAKLRTPKKANREPSENNLSTSATYIPLQDDAIFRDPF